MHELHILPMLCTICKVLACFLRVMHEFVSVRMFCINCISHACSVRRMRVLRMYMAFARFVQAMHEFCLLYMVCIIDMTFACCVRVMHALHTLRKHCIICTWLACLPGCKNPSLRRLNLNKVNLNFRPVIASASFFAFSLTPKPIRSDLFFPLLPNVITSPNCLAAILSAAIDVPFASAK